MVLPYSTINNTLNCKRRFEPSSPTVYKRPTHEQLDLAVTRDEQGFFCTTPNELPTRDVMLLRPKVAETTPLDTLQPKQDDEHLPKASKLKLSQDDHLQRGGDTGYRFVNVNSTVILGIQAALDHQRTNPEWDGQPKLMPSGGAEVRPDPTIFLRPPFCFVIVCLLYLLTGSTIDLHYTDWMGSAYSFCIAPCVIARRLVVPIDIESIRKTRSATRTDAHTGKSGAIFPTRNF